LAATFTPKGQGLLKHTIDMARYERTSEAVEASDLTREEDRRTFVACGNGWLDTGDAGYWLEDQLVVTGRYKDLILWHGRNIWPQDIEWAAQAAAPHRCGRACAFAKGGAGDEKTIMLLLECRTREEKLLDEIYTAVTAAIRLEVGVPVHLMLVPRSTMIITSSGKLSRARVKAKYLEGGVIDLQAEEKLTLVAESGEAG